MIPLTRLSSVSSGTDEMSVPVDESKKRRKLRVVEKRYGGAREGERRVRGRAAWEVEHGGILRCKVGRLIMR